MTLQRTLSLLQMSLVAGLLTDAPVLALPLDGGPVAAGRLQGGELARAEHALSPPSPGARRPFDLLISRPLERERPVSAGMDDLVPPTPRCGVPRPAASAYCSRPVMCRDPRGGYRLYEACSRWTLIR